MKQFANEGSEAVICQKVAVVPPGSNRSSSSSDSFSNRNRVKHDSDLKETIQSTPIILVSMIAAWHKLTHDRHIHA